MRIIISKEIMPLLDLVDVSVKMMYKRVESIIAIIHDEYKNICTIYFLAPKTSLTTSKT